MLPPPPPPVSCRICRFHLFSYRDVLDSHGCYAYDRTHGDSCSSDVWYFSEEKLPDWMKKNVDTGDWVKGKLFCPKCLARIGSYNFVSGMKCPCGSHVLPTIHVVKSKVDVIISPLPYLMQENSIPPPLSPVSDG